MRYFSSFNSKPWKSQVYFTRESMSQMGNDLTTPFSGEDLQVASKHMKMLSTLLVMREMHRTRAARYHLRCIKMALLKN